MSNPKPTTDRPEPPENIPTALENRFTGHSLAELKATHEYLTELIRYHEHHS